MRIKIHYSLVVAVQLINEGNPNEHPQQALVADAQILIACTGAVLSHIYRQANQSADHLASMGVKQIWRTSLMVTKEPPQSIWHFVLEDDGLGIGWFRD